MINAQFGKNVRKYRELIDMTQDELAKKIGYKGKSTLSLIENGHRDVGTAEILAIANALNVDVTDLLQTEDEDQIAIKRYLQHDGIRRLVLFAGEHIPSDDIDRYVEALIGTIEVLNKANKKAP